MRIDAVIEVIVEILNGGLYEDFKIQVLIKSDIDHLSRFFELKTAKKPLKYN